MATGMHGGDLKTKTVSREAKAYLEHRRAVSAAKRTRQRALATARSDPAQAVPIQKAKRCPKGWQAERRLRAYELELRGKSRPEIAAELGMSLSMVRHVLARAHRERRAQLGDMLDLHRELEMSRAEMLIERFMAIALMDRVQKEPKFDLSHFLNHPNVVLFLHHDFIGLRYDSVSYGGAGGLI